MIAAWIYGWRKKRGGQGLKILSRYERMDSSTDSEVSVESQECQTEDDLEDIREDPDPARTVILVTRCEDSGGKVYLKSLLDTSRTRKGRVDKIRVIKR